MTLMLLALLATQAAAPAREIAVELLFDGKPLRATATPQFSCHDDNHNAWIGCTITPADRPHRYRLASLEPGTYTLHVAIDENRNNPARFPGDYDVFHQFTVTSGTPAVLRVHMLKLMRLRAPWDNNRDLDGMLTHSSPDKPAIQTSRGSRTHTATVTFRWDAVAPGASYTYVLRSTRESPFERGPDVVRATTRGLSATLRLPLSPPGRYYSFELSAARNGRPIGEVFTHDAGVQAWAPQFVVRDWSGAPARATAAPATSATFLDAWQQAFPTPAWFDEIPRSAVRINSYGDLMAQWQSAAGDAAAHRRFYKAVYQAILDHSGDEHLVVTGIHLMADTTDLDDRRALLEFGLDHFFEYQQRTDNCANCMIGDRTGEMVRDLAEAYISRREYEPAIQVIQRLVDERDSEISDYNMALTFETLSHAYWGMHDADRAKAAIREGLRRFPSGWQADQLRRTLARYDKEPV